MSKKKPAQNSADQNDLKDQDGTPAEQPAASTTTSAPAKWPKGAQLAERIAAAVAVGKITPVDLYTLLVFVLDGKAETGLILAAARGVDLRNQNLNFDTITATVQETPANATSH